MTNTAFFMAISGILRPVAPVAPVTFIDGSTWTGSALSGNSTVPLVGPVAAGDALLMSYYAATRDAAPTATILGATPVYGPTQVSGVGYVTCLLYFLTAADIAAGSLTLSKTGTGTDYGASLLVNIFRGVSGLDAFTFAGPTSPIGYPTTVPMTASSITPSASGEAVVMFAAPFTNQYPDDSFTDPAGWTRGAAVATGDTGQLHQYSGFLLNAPTSATGDITATYNVPSNTAGTKTWVAALVALAPGVPPPSPLVLAGTLPAATVGTAWTGVLNFSGDYTGTLTVDASSGTIPAWMGSPTIDYGAKTITWSATPATGTDAGSPYAFTPRITDSASQQAVGPAQSVVVSAAPTGPEIVQQAYVDGQSNGTIIFTNQPAVGNIIVAIYASWNYTPPPTATGWTLVDSRGGTSAAGYYAAAYTHTVASGDGKTYNPVNTGSGQLMVAAWEVNGNATAVFANAGKLTAGTGTLTLLGGSTPAKTSIPVAIADWTTGSPASVFTWSSGWTGKGPSQITGYPYYGATVGYSSPTTGAVAAPTITWTGTRGNGATVVAALAYIQSP